MVDSEEAFSDLTELHRRTTRVMSDSLPAASMLLTSLAMNAFAAYFRLGVEEPSIWSALLTVLFTSLLIGWLGASVSFLSGSFHRFLRLYIFVVC